MNRNQRENSAKYLYDISKGIALIAVVQQFLSEETTPLKLGGGVIATIIFYSWGLYMDRREA